eukprot:scaffold3460_cov115-Isochrysis_galbana.AAC.3
MVGDMVPRRDREMVGRCSPRSSKWRLHSHLSHSHLRRQRGPPQPPTGAWKPQGFRDGERRHWRMAVVPTRKHTSGRWEGRAQAFLQTTGRADL